MHIPSTLVRCAADPPGARASGHLDSQAVRLGSNAGTVTTTTTTRGVEFMLGDDGITITTPITTPEAELLAMATRFAAID